MKVLLDRADLACLARSEVAMHLLPRQDCAGGAPEVGGAIGRTRIPAAEATAVHEIPDPQPLPLRGGAAWIGTNPLRFFEIEDAEALACTPGAVLSVIKDPGSSPPDLLLDWR